MKAKHIFTYLMFIAAIFGSCKKDAGIKSISGALIIINATIDASPIGVNYASPPLAWTKNITQVYGNSFMEFALPQGNNRLNLISSADTTKPFFQGNVSLITGGIYSLYVAGQVSHYDTLLMKDNLPYYAADSVAGARFINLVSDSQPLSINLSGNATTDFTNLAYKKVSAFKRYAATSSIINNGGYNYEVRDASGNVLATFNWNPPTFKNNTLVITGLVSNGTVSVFPVNNY